MRHAFIVLMLVALLGGALVSASLAAGTPTIDWYVMGGGGPATSGNTQLDSTVGQAFVGEYASGSTDLCVGYWCVIVAGYNVYLPVVLRSS